MSHAISEESVKEIKAMSKANMSSVISAVFSQEQYRAAREIWIDCTTFTDFYNLLLQRGLYCSVTDAFIISIYIEKYHNVGGAKYKLKNE